MQSLYAWYDKGIVERMRKIIMNVVYKSWTVASYWLQLFESALIGANATLLGLVLDMQGLLGLF